MDKLKQAMGLQMFGQTMGKFSLNQIPTLNHKFIIANFYYILIRPGIRPQNFELWVFWRFVLYVGAL